MSADGPESIDLLLARWVLGRLAPERVPQLALAALQRGCQSPAAAVLAGANKPTRRDVEDELPALLTDVGRTRPSKLEALKVLVDDCAARIVTGEVEPVAGAATIWALWSEHVGDADEEPVAWTDARIFIGLASECEGADPHVPRYAADIVEEAGALLARGGLVIGDSTEADAIPVFETDRGHDVDLGVALAPSWAVRRDRVSVVFEHSSAHGWHVTLESPAGDHVLGFPWYDDADMMLRGELPSSLPDASLPGGGWEDLGQGWWASVRAIGDAVFIAETDFDGLVDVHGTPVASLGRQGQVELSGVSVVWSRVPRRAWETAWSAARASCATGTPAPSRTPRH